MSRARGWMARLINLFRRVRREQELDDELQAHVGLHIEDNLRQGMHPKEARRVALARLGGMESIKEQCRDARRFVGLEDFGKDLRYSLRGLAKSPAFTAIAVLSLALGIGVNTAVFSVVDAMLLRPFPYDDPDELVTLQPFEISDPTSTRNLRLDEYLSWKPHTDVFTEMAFSNDFDNYSGRSAGHPTEELRGQFVSPDLFATLGVEPLLGRGFLPEDAHPESEENYGFNPEVVIVSHSLWQRRFGGDRGVIGETLWLNDHAATIIGVMPPGFYYNRDGYALWLATRGGAQTWRTFRAAARLAPGVTIAQAQVAMDTLAARSAEAFPETNEGWGVRVVPLHKFYTRDIRPALLVLWGSVAFVLLIASANVAGVLLARASARTQEVAMRRSLGASRWRVARLFLSEGLLLALAGGAAGGLLAYGGVQAIEIFNPDANPMLNASTFPRLADASVDGRVLGYTLLVSLVAALLCSLAPALMGSRSDLTASLKEAGRGAASGSGGLPVRNALVITQVALTLVLVTGAGLMVRSMRNLEAVDLGFEPEQVLMFEMVLSGDRYVEDRLIDGEATTQLNLPRVNAFFARVLQGLEGIPGAASAATVQEPPLSHWNQVTNVTIDGVKEPPEMPQWVVFRAVRGDYFEVMGIALRAGRALTESDSAEAPWVVVINRAMADTYWPNQNPIGRQLTFVDGSSAPRPGERPRTVVGVVDVVNDWSVQQPEPRPGMYFPAVQGTRGSANFRRKAHVLVRTAVDPLSLAPELQRVVTQIDPDQFIADVHPMQQLVAIWTGSTRFYTLLTVVFAAVALVLSLIGIYGVMAYSVTRRTHEIGIRMALGARRAYIARLVAGRGLVLGMGGVAVGLLGAFWLTRLIETFSGEFGGESEGGVLFGVSARDPATFVAVALLLLGTMVLACYYPTRRATKVDPMTALRHE